MDHQLLKKRLLWVAGIILAAAWAAGVVGFGLRPETAVASALMLLTIALPVPAAGAASATVTEIALTLPWRQGLSEWWVVGAGAGAAAIGVAVAGGAAAFAEWRWSGSATPTLLVTAAVWMAGLYLACRRVFALRPTRSLAAAGMYAGLTLACSAAVLMLWRPILDMTGKPFSDNVRLATGTSRGDIATFQWVEDPKNDRVVSDDSFYRSGASWRFSPKVSDDRWALPSGRVLRVGPGKDRIAFLHYLLEPSPANLEDNSEYSLFVDLPPAESGDQFPKHFAAANGRAYLWYWRWGDRASYTPLVSKDAAVDLLEWDTERAIGHVAGTFQGAVQPDPSASPVAAPTPRTIRVDAQFNIDRRRFPGERFSTTGEPLETAARGWGIAPAPTPKHR